MVVHLEEPWMLQIAPHLHTRYMSPESNKAHTSVFPGCGLYEDFKGLCESAPGTHAASEVQRFEELLC